MDTLFTINPGESFVTTEGFEILTANDFKASIVRWLVDAPLTISTKSTVCAGLKKCRPANRSLCFNPDAINVIGNEDVLLTRIQSFAFNFSSSLDNFLLHIKPFNNSFYCEFNLQLPKITHSLYKI